MLVKDTDELTMGQDLVVSAPHALESMVCQPPDWLLTNACMTYYQTLLLNSERITFAPPMGLNPATLLPDPDLEPPIHDCQQVLVEVHGWCKDLSDQPLVDTEATWFTDGSSFLKKEKKERVLLW